jgi:hypothetical protein
MERRALIIFCDNTESGSLSGPYRDYINFKNFLTSNLGGDWEEDEILPLRNPTKREVFDSIINFLDGADYTFTIFSGHGFMDRPGGKQFVELLDDSISILQLRTSAKRQTLIIDACRGFESDHRTEQKTFGDIYEGFAGPTSTRVIFDKAVMAAEQGLTVLYAASENETALDTPSGAAYLLSLLEVANGWSTSNEVDHIIALKNIHLRASKYLFEHFDTIQQPKMNGEKRIRYYPFAVKYPTRKKQEFVDRIRRRYRLP